MRDTARNGLEDRFGFLVGAGAERLRSTDAADREDERSAAANDPGLGRIRGAQDVVDEPIGIRAHQPDPRVLGDVTGERDGLRARVERDRHANAQDVVAVADRERERHRAGCEGRHDPPDVFGVDGERRLAVDLVHDVPGRPRDASLGTERIEAGGCLALDGEVISIEADSRDDPGTDRLSARHPAPSATGRHDTARDDDARPKRSGERTKKRIAIGRRVGEHEHGAQIRP